MSTLAVDNITDEVGTGSPAFANGLAQSDIAGALNATGSAPIYACRAWVNFNGNTESIRASGNVSSITDNGAALYRINFSTALPDANYVVAGTTNHRFDNNTGREWQMINVPTTSSFEIAIIRTTDAASSESDAVFCSVHR